MLLLCLLIQGNTVFIYEFRELEVIAILYRTGLLSEDQMSQSDIPRKHQSHL